MEHYLLDHDYEAVVAAILALPDDLLTGLQLGLAKADDVKIALGERGNVWPASILAENRHSDASGSNCHKNPRAFPEKVRI